MTVTADEFIRRFLSHSLPAGFHRIRYCGLFANCHRAVRLELCRRLLTAPCHDLLPRTRDDRPFYLLLTGINLRLCPRCAAPLFRFAFAAPQPDWLDTS